MPCSSSWRYLLCTWTVQPCPALSACHSSYMPCHGMAMMGGEEWPMMGGEGCHQWCRLRGSPAAAAGSSAAIPLEHCLCLEAHVLS